MRALNVSQPVAALSLHVPETSATLAALKTASTTKRRGDKMPARVATDGGLWRYVAASTLTGDDLLVATPADAPATGRFLRDIGPALIEMPVVFGTADAAILLTVPTGYIIKPEEFGWRADTSFTGGTSSAIGVSSSNLTGYTTKGDLLGGAAGDVAAALTSTLGFTLGTIGAGFDTLAKRRILLKATHTLRFDRVTSAFTAGAGAVWMKCTILRSPAAA